MATTETASTSKRFNSKLSQVFRHGEMTTESLDALVLPEAEGREPAFDSARLKVVYFWGHDCPNCVVAEQQMTLISDDLKRLPADFYSVNAYDNMELVTRCDLYGIPSFVLFKRGRMIGKITSFPGREEFLQALRRSV